MYRLTCKLLALYSLVLPTLAAVVVSEQKRELDKRDTYNGKVYVTRSPSVHCADHFPHREHGTILASVVVVEQITTINLLSHCLRIS
jgi:hypothetical protein